MKLRNKNLIRFTLCCYLANVFSVSGAVTAIGTATAVNSSTDDTSPVYQFPNDTNANSLTVASGATVSITGGGPGTVVNTLANTGALSMNIANNGTITSGASGTASIDLSAAVGAASGSTVDLTNSGSITGGITGLGGTNDFTTNITNNSAGTITGDIAVTAGVATGGTHTLVNSGTITGDISTSAGAGTTNVFTNTGTITGNVSGGAAAAANTFNINGGTIDGTITGGAGATANTLNVGGTFTSGGVIGTISAVNTSNSGTTFNLVHGLTVSGASAIAADTTLAVGSAGTLTSTSTITNNGTLTVATGGTLAGASTITNNNVMTVSADITSTGGDFTTGVAGSTTIGADVDVTGQNLINNGTLTVSGQRTVTITGGTGYSGSGTHVSGYNDRITLTGGVANLTGMNLTVTPSFAPAGTYTLFAGAGGATMATGTVTMPTSVFATWSTPVVATNDITFTVTRTGYNGAVSSSQGKAVGAVLESIGSNSPSAAQITVLSALDSLTTTAAAENALQQLTPQVVDSTLESSLEVQNESINTVATRLAALKDHAMTGMAAGDAGMMQNSWIKFFGNSANQKKKDNLDGFRVKSGGFAVGYDKKYDEMTFGGALSYARSRVDNKINVGTKTDMNSYQAMLYGSYDLDDAMFVDGFLTGTYNDYDGKRVVSFGGLNSVADADYKGYQLSVKAAVGKRMSMSNNVEFTPLGSAQYTYLKQDSYDETGAGASNLHVDSKSSNRFQLGLGGKFGFPMKSMTNKVGMLTPYIQPMFTYDVVNKKQETTSNFLSGGSAFTTEGMSPSRFSANLGLGMDVKYDEQFQLSLNYTFTNKSRYNAHAGYVNFNYKF